MLPTTCENFRLITQKLKSAQIFLFRENSSYFWNFQGIFWFVLVHFKQICLFWLSLHTFSVCFSSFWNKSVCFSCFNVHFRFVLVHFETKLFVSFVSKFIWNTETNRNKIIIGFENEPKQTRNRSCLILVWTEFFYSFRGHPSSGSQR